MATAAQIALPQSQTLYDSEKRYSVEEYLALERVAAYKNEFYDGYIYQIPSKDYNHCLIASNILFTLGNLTQNLPSKYRVLNSDMKIHIPEDKTFVYPDALVICEKPEFYLNHKDVITNPLVVVEVLSSSTEAYDRGGKFDKYSSVESLKEYILIKQDRFQVVSYFREETDLWRKSVYMGAEAAFFIKALAISIPMNEIYDGVEF